MKKKDLSQLTKKSIKELEKIVDGLKTEVIETKAQVKVGKEKNLKKVKNLKVDIAQLKTIIRQKQIEERIKDEMSDKVKEKEEKGK